MFQQLRIEYIFLNKLQNHIDQGLLSLVTDHETAGLNVLNKCLRVMSSWKFLSVPT